MKNSLILLCACCILLLSCKSESNDWITLFDGESLDGWEMKIAGYEFNNNYKNTFGVGDGTIRYHMMSMIHLIENLDIFFILRKNLKIII